MRRMMLLATVLMLPLAANATDNRNNNGPTYTGPVANGGNGGAGGAGGIGLGGSANQQQGQAQGQAQGQLQGQAQSNRNSVRNTSVNANVNANRAAANNRNSVRNDNSNGGQSVSVQGDSYSSARGPAATAYAPTVMNVNPCIVPVSAGGQGMSFGFSVGVGLRDQGCAVDRRAQLLIQAGRGDAAQELLCQDEGTRIAFRNAGTPCAADRPQRLSAVEVAPTPVPVAAMVPTVIQPTGPAQRTMRLPNGELAIY